MNWIPIVINGLEYTINHKKEIAKELEIGVHVIRRLEHLCVHHKTTVDQVLVHADTALHTYNKEHKNDS